MVSRAKNGMIMGGELADWVVALVVGGVVRGRIEIEKRNELNVKKKTGGLSPN